MVRFTGAHDTPALLAELAADRLDAAVVRHDGGVRSTQHQREIPAAELAAGTAPAAFRDHERYSSGNGVSIDPSACSPTS